MSTTVAEHIVTALADHGVGQVWGVVGDALNPLTDAVRRDDRLEWVGVRHEEAAAFAVSAQAQLTGRIGVCMGTVGPGSIHLLNGLYDAAKSHVPVLAITGQVPTDEIGTNYFQEVDNERLFANVAVWTHTLTSPAQLPYQLERAVNAAYERQGVAVLNIPGDVGMLDMASDAPEPLFVRPTAPPPAPEQQVAKIAKVLSDGSKVTMLVGQGARHARDEVLALADKIKAPMVVTLKGKTGLEGGNPYQVGQAGMLGNPAAAQALDACDVLLMVGTDFPYRESYPSGKTVIQIDSRSGHIGRRTGVSVAAVGDAKATLALLLQRLDGLADDGHLVAARKAYRKWWEQQDKIAHPNYDRSGIVAKVRSIFDNPDNRIRPEAVTATLNDLAPDDAIFTTDTGMSTVWAARFLQMRGQRELLGSFNLGSMANALPQALGVQGIDRDRTVISLSGDGGLMMLLGDLRTAVSYRLPIKIVVLNNGSLGMVRLEQEQGGLPRFGTSLDNPNLAEVAASLGLASRRIEDPKELDGGLRWAMDHEGPVLVDVVTNPSEIALPPKAGVSDAWGFAVAKVTEAVQSAR